MLIKICGITTLKDALLAIEAGADMLGFNFYEPSPRYLAPETCANIISELKDAQVIHVGVFVNQTTHEIRQILEFCGLDLAQLHGDEGLNDLVALGEMAFKAIRPKSLDAAKMAVQEYAQRSLPPQLLVDAHHKGLYGGTGETGDWQIARHLAERTPILLAGGLNPANVAEAIQNVSPWGVDVASGVEASPGIKDPHKIADFIAAVRSVKP
jgi:phosphoribosylanthranilate isomerase